MYSFCIFNSSLSNALDTRKETHVFLLPFWLERSYCWVFRSVGKLDVSEKGVEDRRSRVGSGNLWVQDQKQTLTR